MSILKWITLFCSLGVLTPAFSIPAPIALEKVSINVRDKASIKRGAKFFATNCLVCHSLKYLEHDEVAKQAGITLDKMPLKDQEWTFAAPPPDLSLVADARGANWLYTYLHSFYVDQSQPIGSNNLLVQNTEMPNPFIGMQGEQVLTVDNKKLFGNGFPKKPHLYSILKRTKKGSMTQEQFDQTTKDLVTFLVYAADPNRIERENLGWWVLGFLLIFLVITYLLKREYWKDVHKSH